MEKELDVFIHFFQRLGEYPAVKITCGIFVWLIKFLFGTVFRPAYGIVGFLWVIDTITGYYYAWANPAIRPESRRMYHGLVKISIYYFLMMIGYQLARSGYEMIIMIQTTIEMAIMLTEGKSILENFKKIEDLKGWNIPLIDLLLNLFEGKIGQVLQSVDVQQSPRFNNSNHNRPQIHG